MTHESINIVSNGDEQTHYIPQKSELRVILVDTETPGNIGASARAMKSMGLTHLRLINPTGHDSGEAMARAMSARHLLHEAVVYRSLEDAIADCHLVMATSGKIASLDLPRYTPREGVHILWEAEQAQRIQSHHKPLAPALVLGRESQGLTRKEISLCHGYITIPAHPECPSLNLASALQIVAYEHFLLRSSNSSNVPAPAHSIALASSRQRAHLLSKMEQLAIEVGALNPDDPRQFSRRLSELIARAHPRSGELSILQSIIGRALKKIRRTFE